MSARLSSPRATVEVNGARLWYDEAGSGPALLLLHGGLGDSGLWEPVVPLLAERFRVVRTDLRFFGRSTGPAAEWSWHDDVIGVLDELGIERAALVGLSLGGRLAIEIALDHPERLTALALVAPASRGTPPRRTAPSRRRATTPRRPRATSTAMLAVDLEVWAPLGADERIARLWFATPMRTRYPISSRRAGPPARRRTSDSASSAVPTLVVTVSHDPESFREIGPLIAAAAPERAPRRARLRPLRHAPRAGTRRRDAPRFPRQARRARRPCERFWHELATPSPLTSRALQ